MGFELLLIFLIFFTDFIGIRFAVPYTFSLTTCQEMMSTFGASPGLGSIFDMFFGILLLTIGLWVAVSIAFSDIIWKSKTAILHTALLVGLIISLGLSNSMRMDAPNVPDGMMVADKMRDGRALSPIVQRYRDYYGFGHRALERDRTDWAADSRPKSCVWLETGLIEDLYPNLELNYGDVWYIDWDAIPTYTLSNFKGMFTRRTFAEQISDRQVLRPLTGNERRNFMAKQECRKALGPDYFRYSECDYVWYDPLYSGLDYLMDPHLMPEKQSPLKP